LSLEIRDLQMSVIDSLLASIRTESGSIATATGTTFSFNEIYRTEPAVADNRVKEVIQDAARSLGLSLRHMPSGAGHDAQEIAVLAPMGMIFVPSRDGISHSAEEYTSPAQIAAGADVLLRTLLSLSTGA
jgi:N-carbamoyl-L-amino-acid hydrolase